MIKNLWLLYPVNYYEYYYAYTNTFIIIIHNKYV